MPKITGTYAMEDWQEDIWRDEPSPLKLTRVAAHGAVSGGFTGTARTYYLIAYVTAEKGPYTGYTQFIGTLNGKSGSFTLADTGIFEPASATTSWEIVEDSGTDELTGIRGRGGFKASEGMTFDFEIDYTL